MKFVIAALLGLVSSQITECTKDGKCADAKHCCANLTGGDPTGAKAFVDAAKMLLKRKLSMISLTRLSKETQEAKVVCASLAQLETQVNIPLLVIPQMVLIQT